MIILAALSLVTIGETAYASGRCAIWVDDATRIQIEKTIDEFDPVFRKLYNEGRADTARIGIRGDVCTKVMHDLRTELGE